MRCCCWTTDREVPIVGEIELLEMETPQQIVVYRCSRCGEFHSEEIYSAGMPEVTSGGSPDELRSWLLKTIWRSDTRAETLATACGRLTFAARTRSVMNVESRCHYESSNVARPARPLFLAKDSDAPDADGGSHLRDTLEEYLPTVIFEWARPGENGPG
jgi:hypothetical protein